MYLSWPFIIAFVHIRHLQQMLSLHDYAFKTQTTIYLFYLSIYKICHQQNKDKIDNIKNTRAGAVHREELQLRDPKNYTRLIMTLQYVPPVSFLTSAI